MHFNALDHPTTLLPIRFLAADPAAAYVPFAFYLIEQARPATMAEVGTRSGCLYAGFCQAATALGLRPRSTAITAPAESEAAREALSKFRAAHDADYATFSSIVAGGEGSSASRPGLRSIDILSIADPDDAERIWRQWRSALSDRALVCVMGVDGDGRSSASALWAELSQKFPSLALPGPPGLGVAAVGSASRAALAELLDASDEDRRRIVEYFVRLGHTAAGDLGRAHAVAAQADERLRERDEAARWLKGELAQTQKALRRVEQRADWYALQLETIFTSKSWRVLARYRRLRERLGLRRGRALGPVPRPSSLRAPDRPADRADGTPVPAAVADLRAGSAVSRSTGDPRDELALLPAPNLDEAEAVLDQPWARSTRRRIDVICWAIIDWEFRFQRPQQIASQFAAHGHRVFFVSPSRFRPAREAPGVRELADNIFEVELAAERPPDIYGENISGSVADSLLASLDDLRRSHDISSAVSFVMLSAWTNVSLGARERWQWPVVYDCMDEWENFQGIKTAIVLAEQTLVRSCDLLVVTAARLEAKWAPLERPMVLARNAADLDFYGARYRPNALLPDVSHPIVGYYGAIADWFDLDLMVYIARSRPQYQFVLLGGVFGVDVSALKALPNVSLLGQQPYATMPQYLYHFDVCLIPFKVNPITEATDPVKLYEYLSAGKPVVSVDLPELAPCREHIYVARGPEEFLVELDRAVAEDDREAVERRKAFVAGHTWAARYRTIYEGLARITPRASIIIVTYNNVTLTRLCLESILRNTVHPNYEVIVIDNASTDGTVAYLRYIAQQDAHIRVVANATNVGFAAANNQGLALATGETLVLLNNDTVVPHGWLSRLIGHLRDPAIGLVGPVTNFVGNEAKIDVPYGSWGEMEDFSTERWRRYTGQIADISVLAMFCVAMRRDTWQRVGPLDEQFGVGMFEDDDYAHRIVEAGLRVACAGDVFVHHVGQAAFKVLIERGQYDAIFDTNKRRYERKWQRPWIAHVHRPLPFRATATSAHARDREPSAP